MTARRRKRKKPTATRAELVCLTEMKAVEFGGRKWLP